MLLGCKLRLLYLGVVYSLVDVLLDIDYALARVLNIS